MELQNFGGGRKFYHNIQTGKQIYGGNPYVPTNAFSDRYDSLLSPRRRQLLDDDEPGQKYYKYVTLVRVMIADIDTGKVIAGHQRDPYKVVYTNNELTKLGYNYEEQEIFLNLQIISRVRGYDHHELAHVLHKDIDKMRQFRHGELIDPRQYGLVEKEGFFIDLDALQKASNQVKKWLSYQDVAERGFQKFHGLGSSFMRGASLNRIPPSNSATGA